MSEVPLEWNGHVLRKAMQGRFIEFLSSLPRTRWTERGPDGWTLLHYACVGNNVAAARALLAHGLDVNDRADEAHLVHKQLGRGATSIHGSGSTPLEVALRNALAPRPSPCALLLVANGVRLSTVRADHNRFIVPELVAFERGVLRCRAAVVAMLRVKRAGGSMLWMWDKFLLKALALDVWRTRADGVWAGDDDDDDAVKKR